MLTVGGDGACGYRDEVRQNVRQSEFDEPEGVAADVTGRLYVADTANDRIRTIDPQDGVGTLAGNGSGVGSDGGYADGSLGADGTAEFNAPSGVAVDGPGNVYVADTGNNRIRLISASVTTLAGNGNPGFADGSAGPNGTAQFNHPTGVAVDGHGNVYVADFGNLAIRLISDSGVVSTVAGGPGGTSPFLGPRGITVDPGGILYVADSVANRVFSIDPSGGVTVVAGDGSWGFADGPGGAQGSAEFASPSGVAIDSNGYLYIADFDNERIRIIDREGTVSTLAGNQIYGFGNGIGIGSASFFGPAGVATDQAGNVYVADQFNCSIREIVTWVFGD